MLPGGDSQQHGQVLLRLAHGVKKDLLFASVGDGVGYLRLERVRL
jgi:tRNA splicing endonuclease